MILNEEFLKLLEELDNINEWVDSDGKKITSTNKMLLYSGDSEICDNCGCVVEPPYDDFDKPFDLVNGHKLCSGCLADWIKLPDGFIDKVILIGTKDYNNNDVLLSLTQQEVDTIITKWKQLKQAGKLNKLSPPRIEEVEELFVDAVESVNLDASTLSALTEWVDKDGNKVDANAQIPNTGSSSSYKKRFEKLIKYHIDHASSELESITKKDIKDYGFHLGEHYNTGLSEFDREIVASVDKDTGILTFSIFVDGSEVCRRDCKNYEEFVKELNDSYMYLTYKGTPDYDDLLVEWVESSELTEAKADTERLIAFAGEDLANRFLAAKNRLKAPENDLYYWIKNKTADELEQAVAAIENTKSMTKAKKEIADEGAELVCESKHWKVYHITTFEASQKYGRDSKWCITGINNWGDKYWKEYTGNGVEFYFLITKGAYDPRGRDSKFAIAIYPNKMCEVFDQGDGKISLSEIPYFDEIEYSKFTDLIEKGHSYSIRIDDSDKSLQGVRETDDDALDEILNFMNQLTQEEKDNLALFWKDEYDDVVVSVYAPSESSGLIQGADNRIISNWDYAAEQIKKALNMPDYTEVNDDCSTYHVFVEGTTKEAKGRGVSLRRAMIEIEQFISHLSKPEKRNVGLWWNWDYDEPGDADGDIVVQVETPSAIANGEADRRFLYNWDRGYYSVKRVLGE